MTRRTRNQLSRRSGKYNAHPTIYNGMRFDSRAEATRAAEHDLLLRGGHLRSVERQVRFELGCPENVCRMDFVVTGLDGRQWVEEVKGCETPAFRRIRKLWAAYGPMPLLILKRRGSVWSKETIEPKE